ncbi:MAG: PorV/PorQ family protein [Elusimicrobia bacterium]|nr:PorV/PorQ family protein [Elusimicrobiota bacterium]
MKPSLRFLLVIIIFMSLAHTSLAGSGITGAEFLRINPEARIVGMGETYAAIDSTANAAFTNPAALANNEQRNISATHIVWFGGVQDETLYYQQPLSANWGMGAGLTYLHMDAMAARDDAGVLTGTSYRATDTALSLGIGKKLAQTFMVGSNFKVIQSKLADKKAQSYAVDAGILWKDIMGKLAAGAVVQNIGTKIKFDQESDPLPLALRTGIIYSPLEERNLLLACDAESYLKDGKINIHAGLEYWLTSFFALRAGYKTNTIADLDTISGISAGIGINI